MQHIAFTATLLLSLHAVNHAWSQDLYDYKKPRESQNWTTISLKTKPSDGPALPLVLLIGDSITVRYAAEVGTELKGKAYVSLLGTSKAVGDPALLDEIKLVLRQNVYSVIHFNFGLHGDTADLRAGLADVIATTFTSYAAPELSPLIVTAPSVALANTYGEHTLAAHGVHEESEASL